MIKPFDHQVVSLSHDASNDLVCDFSDPGTGKTYVRIMGFSTRRAAGGGCALVLAPRSLLRSVWKEDIQKFAPHLSVSVADAENRQEAFEAVADVYVTNTDAAVWLAKQKPAFFKRFSELVIDESEAFKHHTSARSKAVAKISRFFRNICIMSGTPNSNSITDIWHQVYLMDGGVRLGNSFYRFRDSTCTPAIAKNREGREVRNKDAIKWTDRDGAEEAVFGLLSDIVVRHKFEDCVSIPANHKYSIPYSLSPKQMTAYLTMEHAQLLRMGEDKITAVNAAVVATKLLQIASGAVYSGDKDEYKVVDTGRYELILDLVCARKHSLVFFHWKHQRDMLIAEAEKRGIRYCVYDGQTTDRQREEMVKSYQAGIYQVMFAHPASAGHGLTLTRGSATIWASPTYNLSHFVQGSKRIPRLGQTKKTETIVVIAKGTIDEQVYEKMLGKDARMTNLLDLFGSLTPKAIPAKTTRKPSMKKVMESYGH